MSSEKKEYDVPEEIANLDIEYRAYDGLRDIYAKLPFGFKKAKKLAIKSIKARRDFWKKIVEMYPELSKKEKLTYRSETNKVYIIID